MREAVRRPAVLAVLVLSATVAVAGLFAAATVRVSDDRRPGVGQVAVEAAPVPSRVPARLTAPTSVLAPPRAETSYPSPNRAVEVEALLVRRAAAVMARDRPAFLADLDPRATAFVGRQSALFDALADVPFSSWSYELDATRESDPRALAARYDTPVWLPQVRLRYSYTGIATAPTVTGQGLTFVEREGRWLLASDTDLDDGPLRTARELWDSGPVEVVRGARSLVLGHPGSNPPLRQVASDVDAAVPRVSAAWGSDWAEQVVVVVPEHVEEMRSVVGEGLDLGSIAAVATAQLLGGAERYEPVGDRVVVQPENWPRLGALGRRIVLTHEVFHVAARAASGPCLPLWLLEGLADHIAYSGTGLPVGRVVPQTLTEIRAGRVPSALPAPEDFHGVNSSRAYEVSWLAVGYLAETYGDATLEALYRRIGAAPAGSNPQVVVADAFRDVLGTSLEQFTVGWTADLRRRLE